MPLQGAGISNILKPLYLYETPQTNGLTRRWHRERAMAMRFALQNAHLPIRCDWEGLKWTRKRLTMQ
jgi:hypothetical protein